VNTVATTVITALVAVGVTIGYVLTGWLNLGAHAMSVLVGFGVCMGLALVLAAFGGIACVVAGYGDDQ
jgi:hypothetical protein